MKKTMLWSTLLTLSLCTQIQAESAPTTPSAPPTNQPIAPTAPQSPSAPQTQKLPVTQQIQPTNQQKSPAASATPAIDCTYKIPAEIKAIDQSLLLNWSEKATTQAFDFDPANIDAQLQKLQSCFTEQGWASFYSALQKSGNLDAIKVQKLSVSSQVDGHPQVLESKENQWKISLPLQVVYQNDKEKVTQLLEIKLSIGRKTSGDLGITQIIATPRNTASQQPENPDATSEAPTTSNNSEQPGPEPTTNTNTPLNPSH